jgi:hypothetical protein
VGVGVSGGGGCWRPGAGDGGVGRNLRGAVGVCGWGWGGGGGVGGEGAGVVCEGREGVEGNRGGAVG